MRRILAFLALGLLGLGPAEALAGDPANGKRVAQADCVACHGLDGIGTSPNFPNLAGQKEEYLVKQLALFKSGERQNPIMQGMVPALSEAEMRDVAAYYAGLRWRAGGGAPGPAGGDPLAGRAKAQKCAGCHGTNGIGDGPDFPNLAGQKGRYLYAQLQNFNSGQRRNSMMNPIAYELSDQDMRDLAAYYASLGR